MVAIRRSRKMYPLDHKKHGVGGLTFVKPTRQKQDRRALPGEGYAVIFFPRIRGIGKAQVHFFGLDRSLSNTASAARVKFMDSIKAGEKWARYAKAGHKIRKVKIIDMGDA